MAYECPYLCPIGQVSIKVLKISPRFRQHSYTKCTMCYMFTLLENGEQERTLSCVFLNFGGRGKEHSWLWTCLLYLYLYIPIQLEVSFRKMVQKFGPCLAFISSIIVVDVFIILSCSPLLFPLSILMCD